VLLCVVVYITTTHSGSHDTLVHFRYLVLFPFRLILLLFSASMIVVIFTLLTACVPASQFRRTIERRLVQVCIHVNLMSHAVVHRKDSL
jgi:hypothetical protein